ncbi:MAG: deoxyhypusine synthase family protein [Planctomycetes bacterium]|nr:deoxyhypusine synthase family protein [Planctomycetota bacterium]
MTEHFRHFNARELLLSAASYRSHIRSAGQVLLAMGGALSTAEIGRSLAQMIRQRKVHAISCTGANLEEDFYRLIASQHFVDVPHYRELTPSHEVEFYHRGLNRITDTCVPEKQAIGRTGDLAAQMWRAIDSAGERVFPHQVFFRLIQDGTLIFPPENLRNSWLAAAAEFDIPLFVPGWEDSSLGNLYAADVLRGHVRNPTTIRTGIEYMVTLVDWYRRQSATGPMGFLQLGGGISGDFSVCAVPVLREELGSRGVPLWSYFCQVGDSTTSYGSYSGAPPTEKITWGKIGAHSARFMIESDATIVAPLLFAYVLEW